MRVPDDRETAIRERVEKASVGPWSDSWTIAHAREDIPFLLTALEAARAELDIERTAHESMGEQLAGALAALADARAENTKLETALLDYDDWATTNSQGYSEAATAADAALAEVAQLRAERETLREAREELGDLLGELAYEGRIKGHGDPTAEIHDPTGTLARLNAALAPTEEPTT